MGLRRHRIDGFINEMNELEDSKKHTRWFGCASRVALMEGYEGRSDACYTDFDTKRSVSPINAQLTLVCWMSRSSVTSAQENSHAASDHIAQPG